MIDLSGAPDRRGGLAALGCAERPASAMTSPAMSRPCSRNVLWPSLRIACPGRRGLQRLGRDMVIAGAFLAVTELRMPRLEPHRDFPSSPPLWVAKFHEG
jgi:hypothetical protein